MATLEVRTYPDPVLSQVSLSVEELTENDRQFIRDLVDTMYEYDGVGIAAPQVGVLKRIIVVSPNAEKGKETVYLNPRILEEEGEEIGLEGCLSLPGISGEVKRAQSIRVEAQDLDGRKLEFRVKGFEARVIQHELDHLNGKLFIDRLGFRQRQTLVNELRTLRRM
ncbi:MAG: peptide deformylase [Candidatus Omnitrophica bacterium]|nr:peptide deformylase [Candidatus Omnitrophota bacterium]